MDSGTLREKFLAFFETKGHKVIPSASLIPENDPTVLFTTAGMHPLVPYLLGEKHPEGSRLCNVQKCVRTNDIDGVGDPWHLTFFEMLGNWSLGDYFKKEAIEWSFKFLTGKKWLDIDPSRLSVSVFTGDKDAPRDEEAAEIWQKAGIPKERIYFYSKSENWWGPAGETGPCGPDTEIFFDTGKEKCGEKCEPKCNCGKYAEIWNLVFMEYKKKVKSEKLKVKSYKYVPLRQKNIDTGMGLERTVAVLNGYNSVYEIDSFVPIVNKIKELLPHGGDNLSAEQVKSMRIIADHLRAATFILAEGVMPSNVERGYVLRRLIRGALRHAKLLGIDDKLKSIDLFLIIKEYQSIYPELKDRRRDIFGNFSLEVEAFKLALKRGLRKFNSLAGKCISGKDAFDLYQSYGFPIEMTQDLAEEKGKTVDVRGFQEELRRHQELSRAASAGMFKGGLSDASEMTTKYHTATHLLHAALREVLGKHVEQRGSNITPERLRFDFSHPEKMTPEQIQEVEKIVNQKIQEKLPVVCEEMSPEEAKHQGAIGLFGRKYGDKVKVYSVGDFSKEICGGPHAQNTDELGHFKILKEESSSASVRRIKAILT
ncbi:MAG: alanyl-tRNA synthetase [Parcubacteria group bacterium LiPW_72]|nr:MAG: alanyl-tRNA synthetase [Parcubacteria group bacterium LiPW_72]